MSAKSASLFLPSTMDIVSLVNANLIMTIVVLLVNVDITLLLRETAKKWILDVWDTKEVNALTAFQILNLKEMNVWLKVVRKSKA